MALLFLDESKGSKKVISSKLFNKVKPKITVVEQGTLSDEYSPLNYNIMAFPAIVDCGKKYIGVNAVFKHMEEMEKSIHRKPLF